MTAQRYAARQARAEKAGYETYGKFEYAQRSQRAEARGFTGYGQQRGVSERLAAKVQSMAERGQWEGEIPRPRSELADLMLRAEAIIMGYSGKTRLRAEERGESLLARTKKGRAIREKLREAFGWKKKKGDYSYYPMMRILYPPRTVSRHS